MGIGKYILDGKIPVGEPDLLEWAKWYESADRTVAKTTVGESRISTVFLAVDHSFREDQLQLFETMVFNGPLADEMNRYSTWDDAVRGHNEMVERARAKSREGESPVTATGHQYV